MWGFPKRIVDATDGEHDRTLTGCLIRWQIYMSPTVRVGRFGLTVVDVVGLVISAIDAVLRESVL